MSEFSTSSRLLPIAALLWPFMALASPLSAEAPNDRLECIAPADPGGGWDFTCRQFASALRETGIIDNGMQTKNMAGGAGGVAFAHVVSKRQGNDGLIVAASSSNATRLAQDLYPGMSADDVTWLGALGADYAVLAVKPDSPIENLDDVVSALKEDIKSVKFATGSGVLGWDQVNVLRLLHTAGIDNLNDVTYLDYNNSASAVTPVLGGHLDVFVGDISGITGYLESEDLRVLAILSEERLPAPFDDLPTAREQGIDVVAPNWRGFYAPPGISEEDKAFWTQAISEVYASDYWQQVMDTHGLMPFHLTGDEFDTFFSGQIDSLREVIGKVR
ncbi:Bug family tripartite tricarboxylate transporter substrate binding protein [Billgrantia sp. LNSP4103-1]|uniref:Bug family tripartite tricarboxylate transporter substrate binding protein n=1 Tax=Billgrantia sp. LNSP4103-1 TaxID=3410266 RepID=UPI00403F08D2